MGLIRKIMIETRNRITDRPLRDEKIAEKLFEFLPESTERVFIYASYGSEVGTEKIIERLFREGKRVFCPKVVDRDIMFFEIRSYSELEQGYQGIPEPVVPSTETHLEEVMRLEVRPDPDGSDIIFVPGVTFDEEGNRMGYGAGMYDRYLLKYPMFKVALAYEAQMSYQPLDDQDEFDVPMDMLITEEKVRDWSLS